MASLSELVEYAKEIQTRRDAGSTAGRVATMLQSGAAGYMSGKDQAQQAAKMALDRRMSILKIQEIQSKLDDEKMQREITGNWAKGMGLLDLSPEEKSRARSAAYDELGAGEARKANNDNTQQGRLYSLFNMKNLADNYDAVPGYSAKGGLTMSFKPKKTGKSGSMTAPQMDARRLKIRNLAEKMAKSEVADLLRAEGRRPEMMRQLIPKQDQIEKYLPIAEQYYAGDKSAYETLLNKRKAAILPIGSWPGMDNENDETVADDEADE